MSARVSCLQEGAQHIIAFAPPGFPGIPYGWKVGFVCVPPQESKVGLSKTKADALMAEFFAERKKERLEEEELLKKEKSSGEDVAEKVLKSREFYGGNFLDSLNPLKQVKETDGVDDAVRSSGTTRSSSSATDTNTSITTFTTTTTTTFTTTTTDNTSNHKMSHLRMHTPIQAAALCSRY